MAMIKGSLNASPVQWGKSFGLLYHPYSELQMGATCSEFTLFAYLLTAASRQQPKG
jgi:hypothetical protein